MIVRWTDVTDIQKKPGLLQETVKVSTRYSSTPCQSFLPTILLQIWVLGVLDVQRGVLWPDQTTSKPGNEKTYLWRQLSPGGQPLSNEQVAQRGYFMLYEDIDLLLKRSKNVPKKSSFLKRDLDARKDSEAYRYLNKKSLHYNDALPLNLNRESAEPSE